MSFAIGHIPWNIGKHHSLESKNKMSLAKKGQRPWLGRHHSAATIEKMKHRIFSEETRKKMSISQRGKKLSEETKRKISDSVRGEKNYWWGKHPLGRSPSLETRQKIRLALTGRNHSLESKLKMSQSQKGNKNWLGKHHSLETKEKLRKLHLGTHASLETRLKLSQAHKGKPKSEEWKRKIGDAQRGERAYWWDKHQSPESNRKRRESELGEKNPFFGKKHSKKTLETLRTKAIARPPIWRDTSIELKLQNAFNAMSVEIDSSQHPIRSIVKPDIFIAPNMVVMADGDYYHSYDYFSGKKKWEELKDWQKKAVLRDSNVNRRLKDAGYTVFRFWEHEINANPSLCVSKVLDNLR